ncbi:unnamed protein product [Moneuplotes crassus]|uniref:Uncharacterized protein n=1 Tax=Euplotes crassus TaxID=5936 RepID=A0AAD1UP38_EUPCR|nr:unnamed protein product [Moneuplotes crassus]
MTSSYSSTQDVVQDYQDGEYQDYATKLEGFENWIDKAKPKKLKLKSINGVKKMIERYRHKGRDLRQQMANCDISNEDGYTAQEMTTTDVLNQIRKKVHTLPELGRQKVSRKSIYNSLETLMSKRSAKTKAKVKYIISEKNTPIKDDPFDMGYGSCKNRIFMSQKKPSLSNSYNRNKSYSFGRARLKSLFDLGLEEYENNYKHKLTDFSSFNTEDLANYHFSKQIGRNSMFIKQKRPRDDIPVISDDPTFTCIHQIQDTKGQTSEIHRSVKKLHKLMNALSYHRIKKAKS